MQDLCAGVQIASSLVVCHRITCCCDCEKFCCKADSNLINSASPELSASLFLLAPSLACSGPFDLELFAGYRQISQTCPDPLQLIVCFPAVLSVTPAVPAMPGKPLTTPMCLLLLQVASKQDFLQQQAQAAQAALPDSEDEEAKGPGADVRGNASFGGVAEEDDGDEEEDEEPQVSRPEVKLQGETS